MEDLTDEQIKEFNDMTSKMMIWMDKNFHPHHTLVLTATTAEISEGVICNTNDILVDQDK